MITNGVLMWPSNAAIIFDILKSGSTVTITGSGLISTVTPAASMSLCTVGKSSGKWYWEIVLNSGGLGCCMGIAQVQVNYNTYLGSLVNGWSYTTFGAGSYKQNSGSSPTYGTPVSIGDVIGFALDMNSNSITVYKNNVSMGVMFTGLYGTVYPAIGSYLYSASFTAHFAAASFINTPPAGYIALTP